ncbi:MAG: TAXI family TRAP transporter solute-binding subunit [Pseudorhodoplanes sp.]
MFENLPRWSRVALVVALLAVAGGLSFYAYRYYTRSITLTVAAGSIDGEGQRLMTAIGARLAASKSPVRLKVIDKGTALAATQAFAKGEVDLAVVRPDLGDMSNARTVVLVTNGVLLMIALPGSKVESIEDLKGKTLGVVGGPVNKHLVDALDKEYDLTRSKVNFRDISPADIPSVIASKQVQALLIVAPVSERYVAQIRNLFPRDGKQKSTLLAVDAAGAIAAVERAYESFDLPKGTIRGSPAIPGDDLTTLKVPFYLVAKSTVSSDLVTDLTKAIMEGRSSMIAEYPLVAQIAAPSTEKDAAIPIHPGAGAYFSGDVQTIFDKYGDQFFYASMLLGMLSSVAAGIWKFMVVDGEGGGRPPERLHNMTARIRQAQNENDLETIEDEIDDIIRKELAKSGEGEVDVGALTIALSRLEYLIGQRRRGLAQVQRTVA